MKKKHKITLAYGDGIGPEIMEATLKILEASKANLEFEEIKIGKAMYEQGHKSGIPDEAWDILRRNPAFLKAPITTPQGGGYKSLNVTIRKSLGLFANVRPSISYSPYIPTNFPGLDIVIIRENEEDLYAGIEHQQTSEVVQALKIISRPGSESIVRYAFEYAKAYGRKKVTCMTKDNIMKHTDGLFHKVFEEIAAEYPGIKSDHHIIDIGSALVANNPERFDVIVTLNLYGDIISDIAAQITGSVGLGGSANVGRTMAMFEAIHGSAPDIAGKGIANPSGLLNGAIMMLVHLGESKCAQLIRNAWTRTLEDGIHTGDIYKKEISNKKVGTMEFADAVINNLGNKPKTINPTSYKNTGHVIELPEPKKVKTTKELRGVDVFLDWKENKRDPKVLGEKLSKIKIRNLKLKLITNRGVKVFPGGFPETFLSDHWRCRFVCREDLITHKQILELLDRISDLHLDFIKIENLYYFDGNRGYSLGQGE